MGVDRVIVQVRCLGPFLINGIDGWIALPSFKKGREFVEYLAIHPESLVSRERLLDAFWPAGGGERLMHRLHLAAWGARATLRSMLGGHDAIVCAGGGYGWRHDVIVESDLRRFLDCAKLHDVASAREGVALYAGDLLAGERADWISALRAQCASYYLAMLATLASHAFECGDYQTALIFAAQLIESDRGHESASRLIMRCYAALGQRCAARAEYDRLAKFLAAELGVEPSTETRRTFYEILEGVASIT